MPGSPSPFSPVPLERITSASPPLQHEVLLIEAEPLASRLGAVLRQTCRVVTTANADVARQYVEQGAGALVIVDAETVDNGADLVRSAKAARAAVTVLVIVTEPQMVAELLLAGCDGV